VHKQLGVFINDAYKLAARILNEPADAYDVVQEAAASALSNKKAKALDAHTFKPWFFKVVRNKSIDKFRVNDRELKRNVDAEQGAFSSNELEEYQNTEEAEPSVTLTQQQLKQYIDTALQKLSVAHREIVLLKDYHDFTYAEIAEILGIAPGSVMSRLHRARTALKKELANLAEHGDYYE
jgi:RNA polymerase sigma-70 factor (ECF subfamily)